MNTFFTFKSIKSETQALRRMNPCEYMHARMEHNRHDNHNRNHNRKMHACMHLWNANHNHHNDEDDNLDTFNIQVTQHDLSSLAFHTHYPSIVEYKYV